MREMGFGEGLGWSAVGKNLGKEVHVYLTLKIKFFLWEDGLMVIC